MINSAPFHINYYHISTCELYHKFASMSIDHQHVPGELKWEGIWLFLILLMISQDEDHGLSSQKTQVVALLELEQGTCMHTNTIRVINLED